MPCTCNERLALTRFPLRLPRTVGTKSENVHSNTMRARSRRAPARAYKILRDFAVQMQFEDF